MLPRALVFCLAIAAFGPALKGGFVFDDLPALINNRDVHPDNSVNLTEILHHDFWGDSIASSQSHKSYRPLTVLVFKLLSNTFGLGRPFAFHLVNVTVHAANSALVYAFLRRMSIADRICLLTALLFAVHPVHCESVAPAVGLADLLYSLLALVCLLIDFRDSSWRRIALMSLISASAVFVKEQGIMIVPMLTVIDFLEAWKSNRGGRSFTLKCLLLGGIALVTFYVRMWAIDFVPPTFHQQDNPVSSQTSPLKRVLSQSYIYALNVVILLAPIWLCFDWAMGCVPLIESYSDVRIAVVVAFWLGVVALALAALRELRSTRDGKSLLICMSLALAILPFVPAINVFFTVGFVIAERNLYLSVFGSSLIISTGADRLLRRTRGRINTCVWFLIGLTLCCFFLRSFSRSHEWTSEERLFASGLKVCPANAKVHYNLAKLAADGGRNDVAIARYLEALRLYPDYEQALNNLGNIYKSQGRTAEARDLLQRAVDVNARFPAAWMNLGIVQATLGDFEKAELSYMTALGIRRGYPDCQYNLGNLYVKWGKPDLAAHAFQEAIKQNRLHRAAWGNLITLLDDRGEFTTAESVALEAIALFPQEPDFYFQLANVLGKMDMYQRSEEKYLSSLALKESSLVWANLGVLYHRWKKPQMAANSYRKALLLDPKNESAKRNLDSLKLQ